MICKKYRSLVVFDFLFVYCSMLRNIFRNLSVLNNNKN